MSGWQVQRWLADEDALRRQWHRKHLNDVARAGAVATPGHLIDQLVRLRRTAGPDARREYDEALQHVIMAILKAILSEG